jgi:hypothetical protein
MSTASVMPKLIKFIRQGIVTLSDHSKIIKKPGSVRKRMADSMRIIIDLSIFGSEECNIVLLLKFNGALLRAEPAEIRNGNISFPVAFFRRRDHFIFDYFSNYNAARFTPAVPVIR